MPITQACPSGASRWMSSSSHHLGALHGFSETGGKRARHGETVERVALSWQASFLGPWGLQSWGTGEGTVRLRLLLQHFTLHMGPPGLSHQGKAAQASQAAPEEAGGEEQTEKPLFSALSTPCCWHRNPEKSSAGCCASGPRQRAYTGKGGAGGRGCPREGQGAFSGGSVSVLVQIRLPTGIS